jgi:hypothetical protein
MQCVHIADYFPVQNDIMYGNVAIDLTFFTGGQYRTIGFGDDITFNDAVDVQPTGKVYITANFCVTAYQRVDFRIPF